MLSKGKVYVGWNRCWVMDAVELKMCYNCSGYSHLAEQCKNATHCPKCADDHRLKDCKELIEKCVNCAYSNESSKSNLDINHSALNRCCKVFQRKLFIKRKNINYMK